MYISVYRRKVQLIGGSTYIISLPKKWVKRVGVVKQSEVALVQQSNGFIIIAPNVESLEKRKEQTIRVLQRTKPSSITRSIISSYLNGSDRITIISQGRLTKAQAGEIKKVERKLIGLETVEESGDRIVIESLLKFEDLDVWRGIGRTHAVASLMQKEALEALLSGDASLADSAISRDDDVDRLHFLSLRQLRQAAVNPAVAASLGLEPIQCFDLQSVTKRIEHIADHAENVAMNVRELIGEKIDGNVLEGLEKISRMALEIHEGAGKALADGDLQLANRVLNKRTQMKEFCSAFRKSLPRKGVTVNVRINTIIESLERIGDYGTDIAEVAIDRAAP